MATVKVNSDQHTAKSNGFTYQDSWPFIPS